MRVARALTLLIAAGALLAPPAAAQEAATEHTVRLSAGAGSPSATLAEISWLAGRWEGVGLGGVVEEIWSPPRAGAMVGAFRLVRDGSPSFYELMTLVEEGGSLVLRLKHFGADLEGWEEKDETVDFRLVAIAGDWFRFDGLTIQRGGPDAMTIYVAMSARDGSVREAAFEYTRAESEPRDPQ